MRELYAEWESSQEAKTGTRPRQEMVAATHFGLSQSALSQRLTGKLAINRDFAAKMAALIGRPVSDFSPRLASEIEELSKTVRQSQPALVITAPDAQPEYRLRTRPALERALYTALQNAAGPDITLKKEYPVPFPQSHVLERDLVSGTRVDFALLNKHDQAVAYVECKTFDASMSPSYKPSFLAGQMWMLRHDKEGHPIQDMPPVFMVCMLENPSVGTELNREERRLQATMRQLCGGELLDGYTALRVIDTPDGQTQLHDLPGAGETMGHLLSAVARAATGA